MGYMGEHLDGPGAFLSGTHLGMPFVIARSDDSTLHAFHNASRPDPCFAHMVSILCLPHACVNLIAYSGVQASRCCCGIWQRLRTSLHLSIPRLDIRCVQFKEGGPHTCPHNHSQ